MSGIVSLTNIPVLISRQISVSAPGTGGGTLKNDISIGVDTAAIRANTSLPLIAECRTSDPVSPVSGQIWIRTDL